MRLLQLTLLLTLATPLLAAPLTHSSAPVSVGLRYTANTCHAQLALTQPATVTIWCPITPGVITLNGLQAKSGITCDQPAQTLKLTLPPGNYTLTVRSL